MKTHDYKFLIKIIGTYFDYEEDFTDINLTFGEIDEQVEEPWTNFDIYYNGELILTGMADRTQNLIIIQDSIYPNNVLHDINSKTFADVLRQHKKALSSKKIKLVQELNKISSELSKIEVIENINI